MATRTILTNVNIKGKRDVQRFVAALENAENLGKKQQIIYTREVKRPEKGELSTVLSRLKA